MDEFASILNDQLKELKEAVCNRGRINLLVAGKTGSAKAPLICRLAQSEDPNEHMHCAWLCISEDGRRIEDAEIKLLNLLAKHIPVVAVITKSRADNGFRSEVQRLLPRAMDSRVSDITGRVGIERG
jgi:hypothetical protein